MKYRINTNVTISCTTIIEAADEKEALILAGERALQDAPHNVAGDVHNEFVIEEFDGEPNPETMKAELY